MIFELEKSSFSRVTPLISKQTNLEARAIVSGNNPGWVFVDNTESPQTALVWSRGIEGFYLLGYEGNARFVGNLRVFVEDVIRPRASEMGYSWFEISGTDEKWNPIIEQIFRRRDLSNWKQRVYTYTRRSAPTVSSPLDPAMRLYSLDERLLTDQGIRNIEQVRSEVGKFWGSWQDFYEKGYGYAVMRLDEVASICYVSFTANKVYALGVRTYESFRGQQLASLVAGECVREAVAREGTAYWDCTDSNAASYRTAESLGFIREWDYTCFGFPF
jgi:RimJ/RimL family protein N-acetyltransferase